MRDINILIKDSERAYGFASIFDSEGVFAVTIYQDRLNTNIESDADKIDDITNGKAFYYDSPEILECLNATLDFWFIEPLKSMPEIEEYSSISEAISSNLDKKVIIYQEKYEEKI